LEKAAIKEAIMKGLSEEADLWLDKQPTITSGYEYETGFMKTTRNLNKILVEKSLDTPVSGSRNGKKKSSPALGK
jgi:hypothetical protein